MELTFKGIKTLTLSPYHSLYDSNLCIKQQNTGYVFSEYRTHAFSEHHSCWRRSTAKEVGSEWSNQGGTSNILSICYCTFASFSHRNNSYWTLQKSLEYHNSNFQTQLAWFPTELTLSYVKMMAMAIVGAAAGIAGCAQPCTCEEECVRPLLVLQESTATVPHPLLMHRLFFHLLEAPATVWMFF